MVYFTLIFLNDFIRKSRSKTQKEHDDLSSLEEKRKISCWVWKTINNSIKHNNKNNNNNNNNNSSSSSSNKTVFIQVELFRRMDMLQSTKGLFTLEHLHHIIYSLKIVLQA